MLLDAGRLILKPNKWLFFNHYLDCHIKSEILNKFCHSAAYLNNMAFYLYLYVSEYLLLTIQ